MLDFRPLLEAAFAGDWDRIVTEATFMGIPHREIVNARRSILSPGGYRGHPIWDNGYQEGHEDGFDDGYAAGFNDGLGDDDD